MAEAGKIITLAKAIAGGGVDPAIIEEKVGEYLDAHPELVTTVQDGSITEAKLASTVLAKLNLVPSLSDEIDGIGNDVGNPKTISGSSTATYVYVLMNGETKSGTTIKIEHIEASTNPSVFVIYVAKNGVRSELFRTTNAYEHTLTENVDAVEFMYNSGGVSSTYKCSYRIIQSDSTLYKQVNSIDSRLSVIEYDNSHYSVKADENDFSNAFWQTNGRKAETSNWICTGLVDIGGYAGSNIEFNTCVFGNYASTIFVSENFTVLKYINGTNIADYGKEQSTQMQRFTVEIPQGCKYIGLNKNDTTATSSDFNIIINHKFEIRSLEEYVKNLEKNVDISYADKKILIIGDSISTDAYGNYKKWVSDLCDIGFFTESKVTNSSYHATGFVADYTEGSYHSGTFIERITAIQNKGTYNTVILFGGINDYINPDVTWSAFTSAVDTFFEYVIKNFTQARFCVILPLRTYNIYPNATTGKTQQEYSEYIHNVAKSYCLPVLNLTEESGFCPFVSEFKEQWTLIPSGYSSGDGVHPNETYERDFLAPMIRQFLLGK